MFQSCYDEAVLGGIIPVKFLAYVGYVQTSDTT